MKLVYTGKTKDVYELGEGKMLLKFKDDVTGKDGVFDPGANHVALSITGMGQACLRLSDYFFNLFERSGLATQYISSDFEAGTMTIKKAEMIGHGLEVIVRFRSTGSFMRRFCLYAKEGQVFDALVEITLKDDDREDPPITKDILEALDLLDNEGYETLKALAQGISRLIRDDLAAKGMELWDLKLEFGKDAAGNIMLVDEVSGGNMRIYKDGEKVAPLDLVALVLA